MFYKERWTLSKPEISWLFISFKNKLTNDDAGVTVEGVVVVVDEVELTLDSIINLKHGNQKKSQIIRE